MAGGAERAPLDRPGAVDGLLFFPETHDQVRTRPAPLSRPVEPPDPRRRTRGADEPRDAAPFGRAPASPPVRGHGRRCDRRRLRNARGAGHPAAQPRRLRLGLPWRHHGYRGRDHEGDRPGRVGRDPPDPRPAGRGVPLRRSHDLRIDGPQPHARDAEGRRPAKDRYLERLAERKDRLSRLARATGWQYDCHHTDRPASGALLWLYRSLERVQR
jgi:hypothetical protein